MFIWLILDFQGRSMSWLARELDVDKSLVSRLRSGDRNWTVELRERAASALGVPVLVAFFDPNEGNDDVGRADDSNQ